MFNVKKTYEKEICTYTSNRNMSILHENQIFHFRESYVSDFIMSNAYKNPQNQEKHTKIN